MWEGWKRMLGWRDRPPQADNSEEQARLADALRRVERLDLKADMMVRQPVSKKKRPT